MSWMPDVQRGLAWALVLCFAIIVMLFTIFVVTGHLPDPSLDVFKQVMTALINIVVMIIGFFFGSSQGSKDKDDARNDVLKTLAANVVGTGSGGGNAAVIAAADAAAPIAAEKAAPAAAAEAAPPAAEVAAPPAAEAAVAAALAERDHSVT